MNIMAKIGWKQRLLFLPPLLIGALLLNFAPNMKAEPPKTNQASGKKVVRVLNIVPRKIQPTASGYGHSTPSQEWEAQSELEGRVVWVADHFKEGAIVKKDTVLLKLDPTSYQLTIARLQAELDVSRLKDRTISASMVIAEKDYKLQQSDYSRSVRLNKTGHISSNELDNATRTLLASQQQLQTLKNNLLINQAEQKVLTTQFDLAKRDLQNTIVRTPFDIRITEKSADLAEYINKGETLLKADGLSAVEISAQFPLGKMRPLRQAEKRSALDSQLHAELSAVVQLKAGDKLIEWQAMVDRSGGSIDAQTQSQSIVVKVNNPYQQASPGHKPPLIRGTFVKVTLKAPALKKQILIPVSAIHNNKVYLINSTGKLKLQPIIIDFIQGQIAVIKSGLKAKDKVILSKLTPAVNGMSLKGQPDNNIAKWLDSQTGFTLLNENKAKDKS